MDAPFGSRFCPGFETFSSFEVASVIKVLRSDRKTTREMSYQQMNSYDGSIYGQPAHGDGLGYRGPLGDFGPLGYGGGYPSGQWGAPDPNFDRSYIAPPQDDFSGPGPSPSGSGSASGSPEPDYVFSLDSDGMPEVGVDRDGSAKNSKKHRGEKKPPSGGFELVQTSAPNPPATGTKSVRLVSPLLLFFLFALVYVALNFWVRAGNDVISDYFHDGGEISTQWLIFYACFFTIVVFAVSSFIDIPILSVEMLTPSA